MLAAVDALHHRATLSEAEFKTLAAHYDEDKILEIILLCGFCERARAASGKGCGEVSTMTM